MLVSVGRRPSLSGIDAKALGLALGPRGEIAVDDQMRTNLPDVYAIGDAVGGMLLAHKAEDEGMIAAEVIAGQKSHMHYGAIPAVVYTTPEVVGVGLTEEQVKESGRAYKVGRFPYTANARARTAGDATGFVKLIADAETDRLLGAHLIGPTASELVAELTLTLEFGGSSEDIALTVHPHPTLSEATREAALAVLGRAIHILTSSQTVRERAQHRSRLAAAARRRRRSSSSARWAHRATRGALDALRSAVRRPGSDARALASRTRCAARAARSYSAFSEEPAAPGGCTSLWSTIARGERASARHSCARR